jgi:hypothetical protein
MEQNKAGIPVFVVINKKDDSDDRLGALRQAQKTVGEIVCTTLNPQLSMAGTKRKQ